MSYPVYSEDKKCFFSRRDYIDYITSSFIFNNIKKNYGVDDDLNDNKFIKQNASYYTFLSIGNKDFLEKVKYYVVMFNEDIDGYYKADFSGSDVFSKNIEDYSENKVSISDINL